MTNSYDTLKLSIATLIASEMGIAASGEGVADMIEKALAASGKGRAEFRVQLFALRMDMLAVCSFEETEKLITTFVDRWAGLPKSKPVNEAIEYVVLSEVPTDTTAPADPPPVFDPSVGMKFDSGKLRYELVDAKALAWLVGILTYGAVKYAPNNWRKVEDWRERYYAALMRHIELWRAGEEFDSDTGGQMHHLSGAMFSVMCLLALSDNTPIAGIQARTREAIRLWKEKNK